MVKDFYKDLAQAKSAEQLVLKVLEERTPACLFYDVSNNRDCYYKGDIKVFAPSGAYYYVEVKNDSRIAETHNILCEEEVYFKDYGEFQKGNMSCSSDFYAIVSAQERKIYILDFKILQRIYKQGRYKVIPHYDQDTHCYLLALDKARKAGALIDIIEY